MRAMAATVDAETKIINFRPPRRVNLANLRRLSALIVFGLSLLLVSVLALNWQARTR